MAPPGNPAILPGGGPRWGVSSQVREMGRRKNQNTNSVQNQNQSQGAGGVMPNGPPPDRVERVRRAINTNTGGAEWPGRPGPPQTLDTLDEEKLKELLKKNRFCRGRQRRWKYVCGSKEISEEERGRAVELLVETVRRLVHWYVWDVWWVGKYRKELLEIKSRAQLLNKYGDKTVNGLMRLIGKFEKYIEQLQEYWQEVGYEVRGIINDLLNGRVEVIIRNGEGITIYGKHLTLEANKTASSITVQIVFRFRGITIKTPDVLGMVMNREEYAKFLLALRLGFAVTDESVYYEGKIPQMVTTQVWQAVLWSILYPGHIYMLAHGIHVNKNGVSIELGLRAKNYRSLKDRALEIAKELGEDALPVFLFAAVLGDGSALIVHKARGGVEPIICIAISSYDFDKWESIVNRLGIRWWAPETKNSINSIYYYDNNAIDLARRIINSLPHALQDLLDVLSFGKWLNLKEIARMEMKFRRGENQIEVAGIKFSVYISEKGRGFELRHKVKSETEIHEIINKLRSVYGEDFMVGIYESGKYTLIRIPAYIAERYDDIKRRVISVLCKKFMRAKNEEKRQYIATVLRRLAPTKGAAAVRNGL